MKSSYIALMMILSSIPAFAGFGEGPPIRWGKVSPAEFSVMPQDKDSAAPAIVLCDFGDIKVTNRTFYTRHIRLKILKPDGLKYASVEIPYQTNNRHDDFIKLKARTLVMEHGKIVTYQVASSAIEDIKINDRWNKIKFTFPNVQPGAIIEYLYEVASLDFEKLDTWYFQHEIPVIWSEIRFEVPDPYVYLVTYESNRALLPDEEMAFGRKLQWLYDTKPRPRRTVLAKSSYLLYATAENRYKVWAMNNTKKKIVMRNIPGLSAGTGSQPVTSSYPQVRFNLFESSGNLPWSFKPLVLTTHKDYENRGEWNLMHDRTAIPGYVHFRLDTWSEFNAALLNHDRFGMYLTKNAGSKQLIDNICDNSNDRVVKLEAVFEYVRNNYRWNGAFTLYADQDFEDFMQKKTGSSSEINLVLVNLLRQAGISAWPLIIRTVDNGPPEKMYPVKGQFNHVIAVAEIAGVQILLDTVSGTDDMTRLHKLDIGTQGWIVREDDPGWIDIFSGAGVKEDDEGTGFSL
jgi:hypothetical protein